MLFQVVQVAKNLVIEEDRERKLHESRFSLWNVLSEWNKASKTSHDVKKY